MMYDRVVLFSPRSQHRAGLARGLSSKLKKVIVPLYFTTVRDVRVSGWSRVSHLSFPDRRRALAAMSSVKEGWSAWCTRADKWDVCSALIRNGEGEMSLLSSKMWRIVTEKAFCGGTANGERQWKQVAVKEILIIYKEKNSSKQG